MLVSKSHEFQIQFILKFYLTTFDSDCHGALFLTIIYIDLLSDLMIMIMFLDYRV